jgi:hypothetical protein
VGGTVGQEGVEPVAEHVDGELDGEGDGEEGVESFERCAERRRRGVVVLEQVQQLRLRRIDREVLR